MLFEAHRGVSTEFPENTLPAFVAAKEQGYHMIELDPRVTADGQWVVHHDSKVGRTCRLPSGEPVSEEPIPLEQVSYAQLALYDAGLWKGEQFRGTKVPLLKEVLDFARQADMELKLDNVFAKAPQEQQNKLFDEVEAALDEANVDAFGEYLDKYRDKTQFVIITHKKKTMEFIDTLYGITMQESGVSKLVSVKLDDIKSTK